MHLQSLHVFYPKAVSFIYNRSFGSYSSFQPCGRFGLTEYSLVLKTRIKNGFRPFISSFNSIIMTHLRLMHVVDSLEFGGLERVVTDLAIEQKHRGHHVSVFSILETRGFTEELQKAGIEVISGRKKKSLDFQVIKAIQHQCQKHSIQLLHSHNFVPNYYAAFSTIGSANAPKLVGTCHDMGMRLSNFRLRTLYKMSLMRTDGLAMVGKQVHDKFVQMGLTKNLHAKVVLNGIPVDRFSPTDDRRVLARKKLGFSSEELVIGAVGRLVNLKNHRLLIDAFSKLAPKHPYARLVIIGAGPLEEELRSRVQALRLQDRITLTGQRSDVADLTPAFDIFALPSLTEGLSIALLEACATGLPIIATEVGGNPEIIQHEKNGLLIPSEDVNALEQSLVRLLEDASLRQELGQQALNWVGHKASARAMADAYDEFYHQCGVKF